MAKNFKDLSEQEILALAMSSEETDGRVYSDFAAGLSRLPRHGGNLQTMEAEEDEHRRQLIEEYRRRFGDHIPLVRREDVKGFIRRKTAHGRLELFSFFREPRGFLGLIRARAKPREQTKSIRRNGNPASLERRRRAGVRCVNAFRL